MALNASHADPSKLESLFDNLNSDYADLYSEGTLQVEYIQKLMSMLKPGSVVLDIGCASGIPNGKLLSDAGMHITGIDISAKMVEQARNNVQNGHFIQGSIREYTPRKEEKFDAIVCSLVLMTQPSHWSYTMAFRMASWLKPTGYILLGTVDYTDYPVAPGNLAEPTGESLHHTFMGYVLKDSTMVPGDWLTVLRQAEMVPVVCEQRTFEGKVGDADIEPEPQFFMVAKRTGKDPLLGPYSHPYQHYPVNRSELFEQLLERRKLEDSDIQLTEAILTSSEDMSPSSTTTSIRLDWALHSSQEVHQVAGQVLEAYPNLETISIIQASPTNEVLRIVNEIRKLLRHGPQHHGVLLKQTIDFFGQNGTRLNHVPSYLDLSDASSLEEAVQKLAQLIIGVWFVDLVGEGKEDGKAVTKLAEWHVLSYFDEYRQLGFEHGKKIGFDCVELVIDLKK